MTSLPPRVLPFLLLFVKRQGYGLFALMVLCIGISIATNTIIPNLGGEMANSLNSLDIAVSSSIGKVNYAFAALIIAWFATECMQRLKGAMMGFIFPSFEADIRVQCANYVIHQPYTFFSVRYGAAIGYRIDDLPRSLKLITDNVMTLFIPLFISICASCFMFFRINAFVGTLFFCWFAIYIGLVVYFGNVAVRHTSKQSLSRAKIQSRVADVLRNYLNIRIFDHLKYETENLKKVQDEEMKRYRKTVLYVEKSKLVLSLFSGCGIIYLFWICIARVQNKLMTTGDFIFIISSVLSIMNNLWWIADEMPYIINEIGICNRSLSLIFSIHGKSSINQVNEEKSETLPDIKLKDSSISFRNVTFSYISPTHSNENDGGNSNETPMNIDNIGDDRDSSYGIADSSEYIAKKIAKRKSQLLFHDLNVEIPNGQKVALVGLSGSGKTTFVKLFLGLYKVQNGEILVGGSDISQYSHSSLMNNISFMQQEPILFSRTIRENISYGKLDATMDEIIEAAIQAECHDFISSLPMQYDTVIVDTGANISAGQKQRIIIARTFLKNAPILVIDEATSALDVITESLIQKNFNRLMKDRTTVVIAHKLNTLQGFERIIVFHGGEIIEDGSHDELVQRRNGHYARMWSIYQSQD